MKHTRTAILSVPKKDFLKVVMKEGNEIELADAQENHRAAIELMGDKKYTVLVDGRLHNVMTEEAKNFSSEPETYKNVIAMAIIVSSLTTRLVGMFVMRFHSNKGRVVRLFKEEADAMRWLDKKLEEEKSRTSLR